MHPGAFPGRVSTPHARHIAESWVMQNHPRPDTAVMRRLASAPAAFAIALILALGACATRGSQDMEPLATRAAVDLPRFMGSWHVIAHIPYWPERGKVAARDIYTLRDDGRVDNVYAFRNDFDSAERRWNGVSEVVPGSNNAHWKVQFIWPFKVDLLVLEVGPDYEWALLGHPRRRYAWVFGREADMPETQYRELVARFARHGYRPDDLVRVPQLPSQVGQPGFAQR
jgi:apolipoprotein D and lipocalin family protein